MECVTKVLISTAVVILAPFALILLFIHHAQQNKKVWDGIELEEVIPPFEVVGDNLIKHFSHENHILRLERDGTTLDGKTRCEACVSPVYSDPIYSCEQCDFILHQTCANLPMKKRLPFSNTQFKLPSFSLFRLFYNV